MLRKTETVMENLNLMAETPCIPSRRFVVELQSVEREKRRELESEVEILRHLLYHLRQKKKEAITCNKQAQLEK